MGTTITLIADLFAHVGPGLVFAFALPVFLGLGAVVLHQSFRRVRSRQDQVTDAA